MSSQPRPQTLKKPPWLKVKLPTHENFFYVSNLVQSQNLNTICQSAKCPNISECWTRRTATFLILGNTCTRECAFCAVNKGSPVPPSPLEPKQIAETVASMGLEYAVITSVTRDDLTDGGASQFTATIHAIRSRCPKTKIEVLIPDFSGSIASLQTVMAAAPDVLNHNIEVPESLYPQINRLKANYKRSLNVLKNAAQLGAVTKSGLMIGLGENETNIMQTFKDLRQADCDLLTIGQYLQPSKENARVIKYYSPQEFSQLKHIALDMGFREVESGPLVRSSYQANRLYKSIQNNIG